MPSTPVESPSSSPTSLQIPAGDSDSTAEEALVDVLDECLAIMIQLLSSATGKSPKLLQAEIDLLPVEDDLDQPDTVCKTRSKKSRRTERKKTVRRNNDKTLQRKKGVGIRRQMDYFQEVQIDHALEV
jgi:hypothetical protein